MHSSRRTLLTLALLLSVSSALASSPGLDELADQLKEASDFRVRVSAALQLGKSLTNDAVAPLVAALDDGNASVRAAAAAALKNLGDQAALDALKAHRADKSEAVRAQVLAAIKSLEEERISGPKPKVLIKIGMMKNESGVKSKKIESQLADASRRKLSALPRVRVLPAEGSEPAETSPDKPSSVPMVMVTGNISELKASRDGRSITYSASVEYVLHTMPEQAIAAKVSGRASATASEREAEDASALAELRRSVLEAAIASALRRAPPALLAAAHL
ncbi:MAG TPA: HEAT repeat domain-containing protein [Polyangiaceae bacterium]|nr:HEAT repeat domain-containing protein [Polyangiaceae bacterium]